MLNINDINNISNLDIDDSIINEFSEKTNSMIDDWQINDLYGQYQVTTLKQVLKEINSSEFIKSLIQSVNANSNKNKSKSNALEIIWKFTHESLLKPKIIVSLCKGEFQRTISSVDLYFRTYCVNDVRSTNRFISDRFTSQLFDMIELGCAVSKSYSKFDKLNNLRDIDAKLESSRHLLSLLVATNDLSLHRYAILLAALAESGKLLGGWINSIKNRNY